MITETITIDVQTYTSEQVMDCLNDIVDEPIRDESASAIHETDSDLTNVECEHSYHKTDFENSESESDVKLLDADIYVYINFNNVTNLFANVYQNHAFHTLDCQIQINVSTNM
ncbi:hypothetical protein FQA39_LY14409 [Lamprigera yunnana]|nr:hypothetical protein FQA39_LY14409 [Lamprigera yunnana]